MIVIKGMRSKQRTEEPRDFPVSAGTIITIAALTALGLAAIDWFVPLTWLAVR